MKNLKEFTPKVIFKIAFVLSILVVIGSCKKDKQDEKLLTPQFLYVGHTFTGDSYLNSNRRNAILVINDSLVKLSPNNRSDGQAVFGNGKDIFVAGYQHNGTENKRLVYWKNSTLHFLSPADLYNNNARAIYEDNGNVYVAGTEYIKDNAGSRRPYQRLWVNGVVKVNQGVLDFSAIEDITTYNGQFFLAGQFAQSASIWYDQSMRTILVQPSNVTHIKKTATDTIALGYSGVNLESDAIIAWKNGSVVFSHTLGHRVVNALSDMSGDDYYFLTVPSTSTSTPPKVFKNNTLLFELAPGKSVRPVAIRVFRNKVYALGNIMEGSKSIPTLWVDGQPQTLHTASENIYLNDFYIAETE